MVRSLMANDPHRIKALKGPEQKLEAHPNACELEELREHVERLKEKKPLAVDLFCGAGGLSLGLHRAGFEVILGADIRPDSIATHRHHFGGCSHKGDLSDPAELKRIIDQLNRCDEIALVAGGPPCQPFSRNIRWRKHDEDAADQHRELNSRRRELWESFMTVVEDVRPRAFLMENVPPVIRRSSAKWSAKLKQRITGSMPASSTRGNTEFRSFAPASSLPVPGSATAHNLNGRNLSSASRRRLHA